MKTLLVATDYTEASRLALEYAATLASHIRAKVVLYNAFEIPGETSILGNISPHIYTLLEENKLRLKEMAHKTAQKYSIETDWVTNISFAEEEIDRQVKAFQADLVVVGMKKEAADYPVFGSTTTTLIGKGKYPVLVIPEGAKIKEPSRLLFACNYQCLSPNNSLPLLKEIALAFKAKVEVLHVEKPREIPVGHTGTMPEQLPDLEALLKGLPHEYRDVTESGVIKGIERSIQEYQADMLVMVPHKQGFWSQLFQQSTTRKMAFKSTIPLLCLPNMPDNE